MKYRLKINYKLNGTLFGIGTDFWKGNMYFSDTFMEENPDIFEKVEDTKEIEKVPVVAKQFDPHQNNVDEHINQLIDYTKGLKKEIDELKRKQDDMNRLQKVLVKGGEIINEIDSSRITEEVIGNIYENPNLLTKKDGH